MAETRVRRWLTGPRLLLAVMWATLLMLSWRSVRAFDIWLHMKSGELILTRHIIHDWDPYSFTAYGRPWNNHQWLGCILLRGVWAWGGTWALVVFRCVVIGIAFVWSWALARRRGVDAGLAMLLVLAGAYQMRMRALTRPYLISFIMFMAVVWVLYGCITRPRLQRRPASGRPFADEDRYLWGQGGGLLLLPALMLCWANLHAGYLMGLVLIGTFGVGEMIGVWASAGGKFRFELLSGPLGARFRAMLVAGTAAFALCVVTPYGAETLMYPFRLTMTVSLLSRIAEWKPVQFAPAYNVYWCLLIVGWLVMLRAVVVRGLSGQLRGSAGEMATDLLLFGGFSYLPLTGVRHIAWILLLAPVILGKHVFLLDGPTGPVAPKRLILASAALALALALGPLKMIRHGVEPPTIHHPQFPARACRFMERNGLVDLRAYNSYEWGGFLIWLYGPERKVFVDGRCLVYRDDLLAETFAVSDGDIGTEPGKPNWRDVLDRWDVKLLLFRHGRYDSSHLFRDRRWRCVYWDDGALVALRADEFEKRHLLELRTSNPSAFRWKDGPTDPMATLDELDEVLRRAPGGSRALAEKARCFVALADGGVGPRARNAYLGRAGELIAEAHGRGSAWWVWVADYHLARSRGDSAAMRDARKQVFRTVPVWMEESDVNDLLGPETGE